MHEWLFTNVWTLYRTLLFNLDSALESKVCFHSNSNMIKLRKWKKYCWNILKCIIIKPLMLSSHRKSLQRDLSYFCLCRDISCSVIIIGKWSHIHTEVAYIVQTKYFGMKGKNVTICWLFLCFNIWLWNCSVLWGYECLWDLSISKQSLHTDILWHYVSNCNIFQKICLRQTRSWNMYDFGNYISYIASRFVNSGITSSSLPDT